MEGKMTDGDGDSPRRQSTSQRSDNSGNDNCPDDDQMNPFSAARREEDFDFGDDDDEEDNDPLHAVPQVEPLDDSWEDKPPAGMAAAAPPGGDDFDDRPVQPNPFQDGADDFDDRPPQPNPFSDGPDDDYDEPDHFAPSDPNPFASLRSVDDGGELGEDPSGSRPSPRKTRDSCFSDSFAYRSRAGGDGGAWDDELEDEQDKANLALVGIVEESDDEDGDADGGDLENGGKDGGTKSTGARKVVKNKYCKAAVMCCVIWGITAILISLALSMDWWGAKATFGLSQEASCTLCGDDDGIDLIVDEEKGALSPPVTGQNASSSNGAVYSPLSVIDPPPADLAEVCAPSIHLQRNSATLVQGCIETCLPAACCLVNNDEAIDGLVKTLGLLGMGGGQATTFLSAIEDCYSNDTIPVCDAYGEWCSTLYGLDMVLGESLPSYFFDTCYRQQDGGEGGDAEMASARSLTDGESDGECEDILCGPLYCCYRGTDTEVEIMRERPHQQQPDDGNGESDNYQSGLRRRVAEEEERSPNLVLSTEFIECGHLDREDSVTAKICEAYAPFCNPYEGTPGNVSSPETDLSTSLNSTLQPSNAATNTSALESIAPSMPGDSPSNPNNSSSSVLAPSIANSSSYAPTGTPTTDSLNATTNDTVTVANEQFASPSSRPSESSSPSLNTTEPIEPMVESSDKVSLQFNIDDQDGSV